MRLLHELGLAGAVSAILLACGCEFVLGLQDARVEGAGGGSTTTTTTTGVMTSCSDGVRNGTETDDDCGGGSCPSCQDGKHCVVTADCESDVCLGGVCSPAGCADQAKSGKETDVDCGGPQCGACPDGKMCLVHADCQSGICNAAVCTSAFVWSKSLVSQFPDVAVIDLQTGAAQSVLLAARGVIDFGAGPMASGCDTLAKFDSGGALLWSKSYSGACAGTGNGIATLEGIAGSASGGIAQTGSFEGTIDFGGGPIAAKGPPHSTDIFVVRVDSNGNYVWSKTFGDVGSQTAYGVALDVSNNTVITGVLSGMTDFGGGPPPGIGGIFVAKLDPAGNHVWSRRYGAGGFKQRGERVVTDTLGNVVIAGTFEGSIDFGKGPVTSSGSADIFVAYFDKNGAIFWTKTYEGAQDGYSPRIAVDAAGNVLVTSGFKGTVDLGSGPLVSAGGSDIVLAKFDSMGNCMWSQRFGDAADQSGSNVAVDSNGNVLLTGSFKGVIDVGGGPLTSAGDNDVFVAKLDASGKHIWSRRFGDQTAQATYGLVAVGPNNVVIDGLFDGTFNFGGAPLMSLSGGDVFLAKLLTP